MRVEPSGFFRGVGIRIFIPVDGVASYCCSNYLSAPVVVPSSLHLVHFAVEFMSDHWKALADLLGTPPLDRGTVEPAQDVEPTISSEKPVDSGSLASINQPKAVENQKNMEDKSSVTPAVPKRSAGWDALARLFGLSAPPPDADVPLPDSPKERESEVRAIATPVGTPKPELSKPEFGNVSSEKPSAVGKPPADELDLAQLGWPAPKQPRGEVARDKGARETGARETGTRETGTRETGTREVGNERGRRPERDVLSGESAGRERSGREPQVKESASVRESEQRESGRRDRGGRDRGPRENAGRENTGRENTGRDTAARDTATREVADVERLERGERRSGRDQRSGDSRGADSRGADSKAADSRGGRQRGEGRQHDRRGGERSESRQGESRSSAAQHSTGQPSGARYADPRRDEKPGYDEPFLEVGGDEDVEDLSFGPPRGRAEKPRAAAPAWEVEAEAEFEEVTDEGALSERRGRRRRGRRRGGAAARDEGGEVRPVARPDDRDSRPKRDLPKRIVDDVELDYEAEVVDDAVVDDLVEPTESSAGERRGGRRRRRRGGRRPGAAAGVAADPESEELDLSEGYNLPGLLADEIEASEDEDGLHSKIPTWEDTIKILVTTNVDARHRPDQRGGRGHGGGHGGQRHSGDRHSGDRQGGEHGSGGHGGGGRGRGGNRNQGKR